MATQASDVFLYGETGRSTRSVLRVIILVIIAAAAVSSRLFSVIRFESIIHECSHLSWFVVWSQLD
jgi:dolichyl-diphosphooligosaccharide---protein glycosyltransferase